MTVSIIIPTYNRAKYIGITLKSLVELNYPKEKYEIIVVDNNSTDDTREVIQSYLNSVLNVRVHYLFEPRQGVHYARNTAAKEARHEILYFTDDDMIADPELLNEITALFMFDKNVAVATGKVLPKWEAQPPGWVLRHCNNYLLSLLDPNYDFVIAYGLDYLYSCHQAVRRDVFFEAEGFNPEYTKGKYLGDGESGLNYKIQKLGYKFGYNGRSVVYHILPARRYTQRYLNTRFANNGVAHSYSAFRLHPTQLFLVKQILKKGILKFPYELLKNSIVPLVKKDVSLYRFLLAKCYYYYHSILFDLKILSNSKLKKFVLKKDWLSNDGEFDTVKM